jgi:hypothetical protein
MFRNFFAKKCGKQHKFILNKLMKFQGYSPNIHKYHWNRKNVKNWEKH